MMEDILMGEESQHFHRKRNPWKTAFVVLLVGCVAAVTVFGFVYRESSTVQNTVAGGADPFLGSSHMCGTCTLIPGISAYKMCKTCYTDLDQVAKLTCGVEEQIVITAVRSDDKSLRATDVALVFDKCQSTRLESGSCAVDLADLRDNVAVPEADTSTENAEPLLSHHHPGQFEVKYICISESLFELEPVETEYVLASENFLELEEASPFLSSALVKCDARKQVTENWDKGKVCSTDLDTAVTLSCDDTRDDVRILVAKVTTSTLSPMKKKMKKNLATRGTRLCQDMTGSSCSFSFSDLFYIEDGETLPEAGAEMKAVYVCSYAPVA